MRKVRIKTIQTDSKQILRNGTALKDSGGLILKILSQNELPESAVEQVAQEITGRQMSDLQKGQASLVVGEVLDRWGKHRRTDNGRAA